MNLFDEQILKNSEVCASLGVSDYHRKQLIARGILDAPIDTGAAHPKHTLSQVMRAQDRLKETSRPPQPKNQRKIKPLSKTLISEIRNSRWR